jgi:hypothetical protein
MWGMSRERPLGAADLLVEASVIQRIGTFDANDLRVEDRR